MMVLLKVDLFQRLNERMVLAVYRLERAMGEGVAARFVCVFEA